jgi:hypothetical protein
LRFESIAGFSMSHHKILFLSTLLLVLGAGVVVGKLSTRLPEMVVGKPGGGGPPWAAQLGLTAEQQKQWDAIWADVSPKIGKTFDSRRAIDRERDQAVLALLTSEQRAAFEKIQNDCRVKRQDCDHDRDHIIHDAEDRSQALLDDVQKKRWDTLQKDWQQHRRGPHGFGGRGDRPGPDRPGPDRSGPMTHATTQESRAQESRPQETVAEPDRH